MRAHALPLQILLAFALILNGIAGAMASVAVIPPHAVAQPVAETGAAATMAGDCAGHDGPDATASLPMPPADDCHSDHGPGCDHGAQCLHACMHVPAVVEPVLSLAIVQSGTDAVLHPLADGHPAPPLGSPTRPPIA